MLINATVSATSPPVDSDQDYGAITLAGAGGVALPGSETVISNAGGTNLVVSGGFVVPDTGGGVTSGTVTFGGGTEWVVAAIADAYSTRSEAEITSAVAAGWSGKTILVRDGTYEWDYLWTRRKTFGGVGVGAILKAHNWRGATFTRDLSAVPPSFTVRSASNFTIDGFVMLGSQFVMIRETTYEIANITIQNCEIGGSTPIDETADWSGGLVGYSNGIVTNGGANTNLTIRNNYIHDCDVGIVVYDDGDLTIEGNHVLRCYEDTVKIASAATDNVYIRDNFLSGVIGNGNDAGNPHPDFIQFVGVGVSGVIEIDRNIMLGWVARAGPQGVFLDDLGAGNYYTAKLRGNLLINDQSGSTTGLRVRQAENCEAYGNTVVGYNESGGPGIQLGDDTTSGTHISKNNAARDFTYGGTPTTANNIAMGLSGATVAYADAFVGADWAALSYADLLSVWSMKVAGDLDLATNVGAVGSGYVVWGSEPGQTDTYVAGTFGFTP